MKEIKYLVIIGMVMFFADGCSSAQTSKISEWVIPETEFPFAEPGPYFIGVQEFSIIDESREGREIEFKIWYPAKEKTDALSMNNTPAYKRDALSSNHHRICYREWNI